MARFPAASEADHVMSCRPGRNPTVVASFETDTSPSNASVAEASPSSTGVNQPVADRAISAGALIIGGTSSTVGFLFWRYSARLLNPSPSASSSASSRFGSRLNCTSNRSSMPSPSVSAMEVAIITVTCAVFSAVRP